MKYILLIPLLFLVGCAASPITQPEKELHSEQLTSQNKCYEEKQKREVARMSAMSTIDPNQLSLLLLAETSIKALSPPADECRNTNIYDVKIAEVEAKNKAVSEVSGDVVSLGKFVSGAVAASDVLGKLAGEGVSVGGDYVRNNITGNQNRIESDSNKNNKKIIPAKEEEEPEETEECSEESAEAGKCVRADSKEEE